MSWLDDLSLELHARGVPRRERTRIVLELDDHIATEPGCEDRLGDPRALAIRFADELATARARTSAFATFVALAAAAVVLVVSQITLGRFAGYPGYSNGISTPLFFAAILGMVVAPQIALVSGTLAAWRAVRRRRVPSLAAAEIALIQRRTRVALGAGFATMAGLELYVLNFSQRLPGWWLGSVGALAAVAGVGLFVASRILGRLAVDRLGRRRWRRRHLRRSAGARMALAAPSRPWRARPARIARGRNRAGRVRGARRALGGRGHPAREHSRPSPPRSGSCCSAARSAPGPRRENPE